MNDWLRGWRQKKHAGSNPNWVCGGCSMLVRECVCRPSWDEIAAECARLRASLATARELLATIDESYREDLTVGLMAEIRAFLENTSGEKQDTPPTPGPKEEG